MRNMRHQVRVMRPPEPQGEGGQLNGQPQELYKQLPCSIENTGGREAERMMQMYATATLKVCFYGDPNKRVTTKDWLEVLPLAKPARRLNIVQVNDHQQNGVKIELVCTEGEGL